MQRDSPYFQGSSASNSEATPQAKRARTEAQAGAAPVGGGAESRPAPVHSAIRHSATHPKFLHSNSTSHQWAFGAIAELIDNAVDPDVAAKRLNISVDHLPDGQPAIVVVDDGNGMDLAGLHEHLPD